MAQTAGKTVRNEFPSGAIEWLAGAEIGNSRELSLARMSRAVDNATDAHSIGNSEESVYVARGSVECTAGGAAVTLTQGE